MNMNTDTYNILLLMMVGVLMVEQLLVIILLVIQNSKMKSGNTNSNVVNTNYTREPARAAAPQVTAQAQVASNNMNGFSRGTMICRKCYNPVKLPTKKCTCCGQTMILR